MSDKRKDVPAELVAWLSNNGSKSRVEDVATSPEGAGRRFVLATVDLNKLQFQENDFNPREANQGKVNELKASVIQLSLLSPLTCAYLEPDERSEEHDAESVVLIDGRHRFNALKQLAGDAASGNWGETARVDLKIFYGLSRSDLYMLATYLNRTRKNLRKGEYYKVVLDIYQNRQLELEEQSGHPVTEVEVFRSISSKAVPNKPFDLSIGRIVAITAFDEEDPKGWYPRVGLSQRYRFQDQYEGYCPLTAGNLAVFLGWLCRPSPYEDRGETRASEITNVIKLGRLFRDIILTEAVRTYTESTGVTVSCKHWVLDAFGKILSASSLFGNDKQGGEAPLATSSIDWKGFEHVLRAYRSVMDSQAERANEYRSLTPAPHDFLSKVWTYQTQTKQIEGPLRRELLDRVKGFQLVQ